MVELYNSGKPRAELVREYELTPSALSSWIKKYNNTGSFHADVNSKIKITKRRCGQKVGFRKDKACIYFKKKLLGYI